MSLNTFNPNNPKVSSVNGLIDAQFKTLQTSDLEVDTLTVDGAITAQAILTDQLAVAGTLYPTLQSTDKNLVIESNEINDLEYTKYNLLGITSPSFVSLQALTPTEVVGPSSTNFDGSYEIAYLKNLQTYKFTADCRFISANPGQITFFPKIGNVTLASIVHTLPVSNQTQQLKFEIVFSILSGAGTGTTQITHSSKMIWTNQGSVVLNMLGANGSGPISTITPAGTAPSVQLQHTLTGLDVDVDSFALNRIY
jgi:hypothetical protein